MRLRLVYKVYPVLLWTLCLGFFAAGAVTSLVLKLPWTMLLWPIPAALLGLALAGLFVALFPRIRFVNEAEVDGLGFVHQPMFIMLEFLMLSYLWAAFAIWLVG